MQRERNGNVTGDERVKVAALVSVGRHPVTGRPRRAEYDARAVEIGLSLATGGGLHLVHAGECSSESEAALRAYLGMGIAAVDMVQQPAGADIVPALESWLRELGPRLVLCGARGETGEASGLVPFLLAERLGWSLVCGLAEVESVDGDSMTVLQALPRGQRRRLKVRLPAVVTVDAAAQPARQSAFGPARRGELQRLDAPVTPDREAQGWTTAPARKRPKRLKIVKATSARDRFKAAAAKAEGGGGQVLTGVSAQAGAEAILKLLREEGVLR
uniref:Electron transfer flavoprotein subunit beta n=1 Tax=Aromatoleum toluolicum TaxID=90060 RepID=A0ABX1NNY8_9RHOO|nr:electron transfer flavoprotein subunit beta [Aromatoleum toluolicum]